MKFTCEKSLLQSAISNASRAVSGKNPNPALEGILFEAEETLKLTGYNLETGICTNCEADVLEKGNIILPARLLNELVRKLPDNSVCIEVQDCKVTISCGFSEFQLMGLHAEDFPKLPQIDAEHSFDIPEGQLKAMLTECLFAVSDNESRPVHTGALFEVEDETLRTVCVDGFRLALRESPLPQNTQKFSFVAPGNALSEVEKLCRDTDGLVRITMGAKHITFQLGQTLLIARRLEGEFLAWRKAIPKENPIRLKVKTKELLQSMDRVSLIISEKLKSPLRCLIEDNQLHLSTKTALGTAHDACEAEGTVPSNLEIGFNHRYMMDALKAAPAEEVFLELSTAVAPCVISPTQNEESSFLYMVLPVRLRGE